MDRLAHDFAERCRRGERPSWRECAVNHPEVATAIRDLFPLLMAIEGQKEAGDETTDFRASQSQPARGSENGPASRIGDYQILREIGRGGMGVVYEAEQITLRRRVALKVLPNRGSHEEGIERFRREARAAARLHHTNIVPIFEAGQDGDVHYYAMQLIAGRSLNDVVDEVRLIRSGSASGPGPGPKPAPAMEVKDLPATVTAAMTKTDNGSAAPSLTTPVSSLSSPSPRPSPSGSRSGEPLLPRPLKIAPERWDHEAAAKICRQAAEALAHAHERGIVHRDIKPSNLILDEFGTAWVTDFGLAKSDDDALTGTGDLLGTLRYIAPERFSGEGGPKSDIYALGLTLYELLALRPAFDERDRLRLIERIKNADPPRLRSIDRRIPADLETIVGKATEKEPGRRYETAQALADDLKRFLNGEPILARRLGPLGHLGKWARRRPALAALSALAILSTSGLIGLQASHNRQLARANNELGKAQRLSEEELDLALAAVKSFHGALAEDLVLNNPELQPLRMRLLTVPHEFYEQLLTRLEAADLEGGSGKDRERIAMTLLELGNVNIAKGSVEASLASFRKGAETFEALMLKFPGSPPYKEGAAKCRWGEANVFIHMGRPREAEAACLQAIRIYQELMRSPSPPHDIESGLAQTINNLALIQRDQGHLADAEKSFLDVLRIMKRLVQNHPENSSHRGVLLRVFVNLGLARQYAGDLVQAERFYQDALRECEFLLRKHPELIEVQGDQIIALNNLAIVRQLFGRLPEAERTYREAEKVGKHLVEVQPTVGKHQAELSRTYTSLGVLYQNSGRLPEAEKVLESALNITEKLASAHPANSSYQEHLAGVRNNFGGLHRRLGQSAKAEQCFRDALRVRETLARQAPEDLMIQSNMGLGHSNIALIMSERGQFREALKEADRAEAILLQVLRVEPKFAQARIWLSQNTYYFRAGVHNSIGDFERALDDLNKAIEYADHPDGQRAQRVMRAMTLARLRKGEEMDREIDGLTRLASLTPLDWYNLACAVAIMSAEPRIGSRAATQTATATATATVAATEPGSGAGPGNETALADGGDFREAYARKAIDFLRRAASGGFFQVPGSLEMTRTDPDFESLRGRPDFQAALGDFMFPADPFQH